MRVTVLQISRVKRLALVEVTRLNAGRKPLHALGRTAMSERIRRYITARLFLSAIVPDHAGGVQCINRLSAIF